MSERIKLPAQGMSERIKLPAQEWLGYDPERGDMHGYTFEQMREFADLLIHDVISSINAQRIDIDEESDEVDWTDIAWNSCIRQTVSIIQNQFGVK